MNLGEFIKAAQEVLKDHPGAEDLPVMWYDEYKEIIGEVDADCAFTFVFNPESSTPFEPTANDPVGITVN